MELWPTPRQKKRNNKQKTKTIMADLHPNVSTVILNINRKIHQLKDWDSQSESKIIA